MYGAYRRPKWFDDCTKQETETGRHITVDKTNHPLTLGDDHRNHRKRHTRGIHKVEGPMDGFS